MQKEWITRIALAILFLTATVVFARSPIPGIDSIPRAVDPGEYRPHLQGEDPVGEPDKKEAGETPQESDDGAKDPQAGPIPPSGGPGKSPDGNDQPEKVDDRPMVRDLKTEVTGMEQDSVELLWDLSPESDTVIYVVRATRPVSDSKRLYEAYNLTSPPLASGTKRFVDERLPEGTYYYAVVTSYEASQGSTLKFQDGQNYLSTPVIISHQKKEAASPGKSPNGLEEEGAGKSQNDFYVDSLVGVNTERTVKLSWRKLQKETGIYNVYRSESPLNTNEAFETATRLGAVPASQARIEDVSPIKDRPIFYGVAYMSPEGTEYRELILNQSFIRHEFTGPAESTSTAGTASLLPEGLKANELNENQIKIQWQDPGGELNGFNLYRSSVPIYNISQLEKADLIGFARKGRGEYLDRDLKPGSYFYGVFPVNREGSVIQEFQEGKTFTGFPIEIKKKESEGDVPAEDLFQVNGLVAVNTDQSVKLSWRPAVSTGIFYNIYRIPRPRTGKATLSSGQKLGYANETSPQFEDRSPLSGQEVFYAITVTDRATNKEHKNAVRNESYINHTFQSPEGKEDNSDQKSYLPETLVTYLQDARTIKLMWVDPSRPIRGLRVYRSDRPVSSARALEKAEVMGRVAPGTSIYVDAKLTPGQYFYALLPIDEKGQEVKIFEEGRSFTGFAVNIRESGESDTETSDTKSETPDEEPEEERSKIKSNVAAIEYFRAAPGPAGSAHLFWSIKKPAKNTAEYRINLYRGTRPLQSIQIIQQNGVKLNDFAPEVQEYDDTGLSAGSYYYAALIEINGGVSAKMSPEKNFTTRPVIIPEYKNQPGEGGSGLPGKSSGGRGDSRYEKFEGEEKINAIIGDTYLKKDYGETVRNLSNYLEENPNGEGKGRALFYMGLSYYQLQEYGKALEAFLNPEVAETYPERSKFWSGRTLERMNEASRSEGRGK